MSKYLIKLILYSLVLGILPTILIGLASYSIASQDIEKKVKEMNLQLLTQTQMRVEQMLKSIEKSATQFANSSLVTTSMDNTFSPSDFETIRKLSKELYNLQSSDAIITQAYLINFKENWGLNLNAMKPLDQFTNLPEFVNDAKQPKSIFWYTGLTAANTEHFSTPVETVTLVHKIPLLPQTTTPRGLLVIRIVATEIDEALMASSHTSSRNYIMDHTGSDIMKSNSDRELYTQINADVIRRLESAPEQASGIFNTKLDGEEVAVMYRSSNFNDWTYISVFSIEELKKETWKIAVVTLLICTFILIIVVWIAMYGSRRMYGPIRSLLEAASEIDSSNEHHPLPSKKNDLEYIKHSMQYLATSKDQLELQMIGQSSRLKEFFVLKLFTGQMNENDFFLRSSRYGLPVGWNCLGVLALQIDNLQETRYREEDRELLLYAVSNIAEEVLPIPFRFPPITLSQSQVTLIAMEMGNEEEIRNTLYEAAECIKTNAESVLQIKVSIGISNPFDKLTDTVKAYGESLNALKERISLGPDIIVHYGDVEKRSGTEQYEYNHLKMCEDSIVYAIKEMQTDHAVEMLKQYLDNLLYKDFALYEHQTMLMQLAFKLLQIVQEQGMSTKLILKDERTLEKIFQLQTRDEIIHWFESKLFTPMIQIISEKADVQYVKIADRLVSMIQTQYDQDITLESCSNVMNYHPFYLSRVFKRETGITFSDFLTDYRMKMAKVLLESTDMKISEISEKMRYKNISSFIRTYKKTYQITPGKYRDSLIKKKQE